MTREELIKKVALKMDEISSSDNVIVSVGSGDNNPLYTQINHLLNESINDVLTKAPVYRLQSQVETLTPATSGKLTIGEPFEKTRKTAIIAVPADFIRVVQITDAAFERPIVDLAIEGDETDKRQHNKFLVAKQAKPVAVLGRNGSGRTITCYSYDSGKTPAPTLYYIKRYEEDEYASTDISLDGYLVDIVSWVCAGKVFAAQGDFNKGKVCDENAAALMV